MLATRKRMKGIMSFTISITIRRSTRVLFKREKIEKAFKLWKSPSKVRNKSLSCSGEESMTAKAK